MGRYRNFTAFRQVEHRDGRTPVTLTGDAPVAQTVVDLYLAFFRGFEGTGDSIKRCIDVETVIFAGVDQQALVYKSGFAQVDLLAILRGDDLLDWQLVLLGKFIIALVMRRHCHNGARTVIHQYIVGNPDCNRLTCDGMEEHTSELQ